MQPKIMSTGTLRFVMCMLCMIMVVMMPMVVVTASSSLLPLSPAPSATSTLFDPLEDQVQRGEEQYQVQPEILQEDYGIWYPAPDFGGGGAAPIPH